jgi:putative transposase
MPRRARIVIPDIAHHVVQRGNNRQNVFVDKNDFSNYCYWINKYAAIYKVSIVAYCLMNNHVHHIVVPEEKTGISRLFNTVHMRYAQYKNYKKKISGHLWQGRFFSCVLDSDHMVRAMRYVEQNPMRAGMVRYPWGYPWSSAKWHVDTAVETYIKVKDLFEIDRKSWKDFLTREDMQVNKNIRQATQKGKAFAGKNFVTYWENQLKCSLSDSRPGRPPKG